MSDKMYSNIKFHTPCSGESFALYNGNNFKKVVRINLQLFALHSFPRTQIQ